MNDLRQILRRLARARVFTVSGILLFGVGIGASTAVFSVVKTVLLTPIAPMQDRLVVIYERKPTDALSEITLAHFLDWRERATSFEEMAAFNPTIPRLTLFLGEETSELDVAGVTPSFFDAIGVRPLFGRTFLRGEDEPATTPTVVLGHRFWRDVLGGDENILGESLVLEGRKRERHEIIGVMPPGFDFPGGAQLWRPLRKEDPIWPGRGFAFLFALGRLAPDVSQESAASELDGLIPQIYNENDQTELADRRSQLISLSTFYLGPGTESAIWILGAAVLLFFLIACVNISSLLLSRAAERRREIAILTALGASRWRIMQAFGLETFLIAVLGGIAGVVFADGVLSVLAALAPAGIPRLDRVSVDSVALLVAASIALSAGAILALGPALASTSRPPGEVLARTRSRSQNRAVAARHALVFVQVALSVFLLVGAGLLLGSLVQLARSDFGYRVERVLLMTVKGPASDYGTREKRLALMADTIDTLEELPGVESVGAILVPPFAAGALGWDLWWAAESQEPPWETLLRENPETGEELSFSQPSRQFMERNRRVNWELVSQNYFRTMGIPLLAGRSFSERDDENAPRVVIVNASFARHLWPGQDPIGQRLITHGFRRDDRLRAEWQVVVGVVGDARYRELTDSRFDIYVPYQQASVSPDAIAVRTNGDPSATVSALRESVRRIDPEIRLERVRTLRSVVDAQMVPWRFHATLLGILSGAALLLSSLGVLGLLSQSVSQRTHEVGVRMALGAKAKDVTSLIVGQGLRIVALGVLVGLTAAFASARLLQAQLYEVGPNDPVTYVTVAALVVFVALVASYLPARRAARVDPTIALRHE